MITSMLLFRNFYTLVCWYYLIFQCQSKIQITGFKTLALYDGSATVYVHTTLIKKWDICSGNAILDATGGSMTTLDGQSIDYSPGNVKNEGGLLAAKVNHGYYLEKMGVALKGAK